jgi:glycyl-tRNA synthetase beta chain
MAELLLEIRSGEIPARMQAQAAKDIERLLGAYFQDLKLTYTSLTGLVGPRRLTAVVEGLLEVLPARQEERRGPRVDAPEQAIQGFLSSTGKALDELEVRETPKGKFYFLTETLPSQATKTLLPGLIKRLIQEFPWPKLMTWGTTTIGWIRPITGGCLVFNGQPIPFELPLSEADTRHPITLTFNNHTVGHRYLAPQPLSVTNFADYKRKLHDAYVIVDPQERQHMIQAQIETICRTKNLAIHQDHGLLEEVTGLVEWPCCLLGSIPEQFMTLPPEVLQTAMRVHQRYFSLHHPDGSFAPYFIVVANQKPQDGGAEIILGNERVLKARLSDAAFFYTQDCKQPFTSYAKELEAMIFHADLGTLAQKQQRLQDLLPDLGAAYPEALPHALQAASIAKADLVTEMVFEFPELQGIMGSYYAKVEGLAQEVAQALYDQYTPKGPNDALPQNRASQLLGLADRLDTLVGFFAVGLKPTGSKDPFALRRAALGVIRYLEADYQLDLRNVLAKAFDLYSPMLQGSTKARPKAETLQDLEAFLIDRLKVYWRDQGIRYDYINAVLAGGLSHPICRLKARLDALIAFITTHQDQAENLLAGYKRATNIVRKELSTTPALTHPLDPDLFEAEPETHLFTVLKQAENRIQEQGQQHDYVAVMATLAELRTPIDTFFDQVIVNDERPAVRANRLKLLQYIQATLEQVVDFSKLES